MKGKTKIASQKEVLEFFTNVMRREESDTKISDAMSAADKLYRHFKEVKETQKDEKLTGVVILPEIKEDK